MNHKTLIQAFFIFSVFIANAQIRGNQSSKIDSLFSEWSLPNRPGGVISVMKSEDTLFSKAYGLTSMEYSVANSVGTIFNTGSVSKQFTAMGVVVLDLQRKLSIDDDIRKYLPEMPQFQKPITIRQLLHHTSGLRSFHDMLGLAGWRLNDSRTNEDLNRLIKRQHDLNFEPGSEFMYCNSGYMLMVNIIENVTGEKFPNWMRKSIFEPLGMFNTYIDDNFKRIVPNNATSYYEVKENNFERAVEYWGYIGSGNMYSTALDLQKWLKNFYRPQSNWQAAFNMLLTLDKLNDGRDNNYAYGLILDKDNGYKRVQHGGSIGGFRSFICVYPEQKMSIVVLTNFSSSSPSIKASQISKIVFKKKESVNAVDKESTKHLETFSLSNQDLRKFVGSYWNDKDDYIIKIDLKNDTLRLIFSEEYRKPIIPIGKTKFQLTDNETKINIKFNLEKNGEKKMTMTENNKHVSHLTAFESVLTNKENFSQYTGMFYSPELETIYNISFEDGKLFCRHSRHMGFELKLIKENVLSGQYPFNIAKIQRNEEGNVIGLLVSNGRVKNLWFDKLKAYKAINRE